ncbi:MAG: hypothetical protein LBM38_03995 [Clostridiales bacterium]|jgi:hypothetical protein|nr:hypothetical protein [Clostridiales bacterium]
MSTLQSVKRRLTSIVTTGAMMLSMFAPLGYVNAEGNNTLPIDAPLSAQAVSLTTTPNVEFKLVPLKDADGNIVETLDPTLNKTYIDKNHAPKKSDGTLDNVAAAAVEEGDGVEAKAATYDNTGVYDIEVSLKDIDNVFAFQLPLQFDPKTVQVDSVTLSDKFAAGGWELLPYSEGEFAPYVLSGASDSVIDLGTIDDAVQSDINADGKMVFSVVWSGADDANLDDDPKNADIGNNEGAGEKFFTVRITSNFTDSMTTEESLIEAAEDKADKDGTDFATAKDALALLASTYAEKRNDYYTELDKGVLADFETLKTNYGLFVTASKALDAARIANGYYPTTFAGRNMYAQEDANSIFAKADIISDDGTMVSYTNLSYNFEVEGSDTVKPMQVVEYNAGISIDTLGEATLADTTEYGIDQEAYDLLITKGKQLNKTYITTKVGDINDDGETIDEAGYEQILDWYVAVPEKVADDDDLDYNYRSLLFYDDGMYLSEDSDFAKEYGTIALETSGTSAIWEYTPGTHQGQIVLVAVAKGKHNTPKSNYEVQQAITLYGVGYSVSTSVGELALPTSEIGIRDVDGVRTGIIATSMLQESDDLIISTIGGAVAGDQTVETVDKTKYVSAGDSIPGATDDQAGVAGDDNEAFVSDEGPKTTYTLIKKGDGGTWTTETDAKTIVTDSEGDFGRGISLKSLLTTNKGAFLASDGTTPSTGVYKLIVTSDAGNANGYLTELSGVRTGMGVDDDTWTYTVYFELKEEGSIRGRVMLEGYDGRGLELGSLEAEGAFRKDVNVKLVRVPESQREMFESGEVSDDPYIGYDYTKDNEEIDIISSVKTDSTGYFTVFTRNNNDKVDYTDGNHYYLLFEARNLNYVYSGATGSEHDGNRMYLRKKIKLTNTIGDSDNDTQIDKNVFIGNLGQTDVNDIILYAGAFTDGEAITTESDYARIRAVVGKAVELEGDQGAKTLPAAYTYDDKDINLDAKVAPDDLAKVKKNVNERSYVAGTADEYNFSMLVEELAPVVPEDPVID